MDRSHTRHSFPLAVAVAAVAVSLAGTSACTAPGDGPSELAAGGPEAAASHPWARVPMYEAVPEMRIDGYEEDLVPIGWVLVADDRSVAVAQRQDGQIRFFGPGGESLASVGRRGAGPGEFINLSQAGWMADTLWVFDHELSRFSLISPDLEVVRTHRAVVPPRMEAPDSVAVPRFMDIFPRALYPDGTYLGRAFLAANAIPAVWDSRRGTWPRVRFDGVIDRIVLREARDEGSVRIVSVRPNGQRMHSSRGVSYFPDPITAWAPDGQRLVMVTTTLEEGGTGSYTVTVADAGGDTLSARTYAFEGERIPDAVADSAATPNPRGHPFLDDIQRRLAEEERELIPEVYPPIVLAMVGNDHRIWLKVHPPAGNRWLVLDPEGEPLGKTVLPPDFSLHAMDGWRVWGTERDELDVQSVVRLRLVEAP